MNQSRFGFPLLVLILCLLAIIICPLTMYSTGPQIANIAVEHAQRPQSPTDLVMMSRTTAPAPDPHHGGGAVGSLAVGLVIVAAAAALFKYGGEALRQLRLVKGKKKSGFAPVPMRPPLYDIPQLPSARSAPRVPVLPDGFDWEGGHNETN